MRLSLNEVETIAAKATRGAGYDWGLAEEAGTACRWLARHGIDWATPLVRLLERTRVGTGAFAPCPRPTSDPGTKPICPLQLGTYLMDAGCARLTLFRQVAEPVLLIPLLARGDRGQSLLIIGPLEEPNRPAEFTVVDGAVYADAWSVGQLFAAPSVRDVTAAPLAVLPESLSAVIPVVDERRAIPPDHRAALAHFEALTSVPASDRSRRAGAGAGLDDND